MVRRSKEVEDEILDRISKGQTLRSICRDNHMPAASAVMQWEDADPAFAEQYARARSKGLEVLADEIVEISDDHTADPNRSRLQIDTRKWLLARLKPKKYGDRIVNELEGQVDLKVKVVIEDSESET